VRKFFYALSLTGFALSAGPATMAASSGDAAFQARVDAIQKSVITLDSHDDIPFDWATKDVDPGVDGDQQDDLVKMRKGGLDVATFIVYVAQTKRTPENYAKAKTDALTKFDAIHRMAETMYPDRVQIAYSADQVRKIHASGKLVALIGIENGYVIGKDLSLIADYYKRGARYMTLTHFGNNDIGDSSIPREDLGDKGPEWHGLSPFGRQVIAEMNRVGMLVDVSHTSKDTTMQAIALSKAPVIASHSDVRALFDHPRSLDDEEMKALAAQGGVMQVVAYDSYLKAVPAEKQQAIKELMTALGIKSPEEVGKLDPKRKEQYKVQMKAFDERWPRADVKLFVDNIDYAVKLMGIDHVGIASDFGGGGGIDGWDNAGETRNVTEELVRRGYTEDQIAKIWGGNFLRVMAEAHAVAEKLSAQH
jgi:membrane dipeptidase